MGENTEIAKKLYLEGRAAYDRGDFGIALEKYQAAYNYDPRPGLLFNISQIYGSTGDRDRQAATLKRYIADDPESEYAQDAGRIISEYEADAESDARTAKLRPGIRQLAATAYENARTAYKSGDMETAREMLAMANKIAPHSSTQRELQRVEGMGMAPQQQPTEAPQAAPAAPEPGPTPQEQMMRAGAPRSQQAARALIAQPEPENWWDYAGQEGPVRPMPDDYQAVMGEIDSPAPPQMPDDYYAVLAQVDPRLGRGGY